MIREFKNNEANELWDGFLIGFDNCNFYQSYANGQIEGVKNRKARYFVNVKDGRINIMSLCLQGEKLTTIPFGPIYDKTVTEKNLEEYLIQLQKNLDTQLVFTLTLDESKRLADLSCNEIFWKFTTILLDLENKSEEEVIQGFNMNRKRILKRCITELKDCVIDTSKDNASSFFEIYKRRLSETGGEIEFDISYIKNILNQRNTGIVVCRNLNGIVMAGLIYYQFGDTLITRHNAFNSDYAKLNPGTFLDYTMIKQVISEPAFKYYDMSGFSGEKENDEKLLNIDRYKTSYGSSRFLTYNWYNYRSR